MRKVIGIVIILSLVSSFIGCVAQSESAAPSKQPETAVSAEENNISVEDVCAKLEDFASQVYENYEVSLNEDKDSVLLYLWQDGLADSLVRASYGIQPYADAWESNKNILLDLSVTVQNLFDAAGHSEVSTSVCVRNDMNLDAVMFVAHNGRVLVDEVTKK